MRILDIFKNPATGNVSHSKLWANVACAAGTFKFVMLPDPSAEIWAVYLGIVGGYAVAHHQGYKSAFAKQQAVIEKMERDKAQALLLSAQNYARELEQARAEAKKYEVKAHAVGMALAKKQAEVSRLKTENKKEIENVLTQDRKNASGNCIDGFGHHGLQLYKRALGYGN